MILAALLVLAVSGGDDFAERAAPVLAASCVECHAGEEPEAELDLSRFRTREDALAAPQVFALVRERVESGEMPPLAAAPLAPADARSLVEWIDAHVPREARPDAPDPVRLRRLNRTEYQNAILDLFGVDFPTHEVFPPDAVGHGFDTSAGVQSISPALFESFLAAAERIAAQAIVDPARHEPATLAIAGAELEASPKAGERDDFRVLSTNGRLVARVPVRHGGDYLFRVTATAQQAGDQPARMDLSLDREQLERFDVDATAPDARAYEARVALEPGEHALAVAFVNDYYEPEHPDPARRDRNLWIARFELVGPLGPPQPTAFQSRLQAEHADARDAVRALARSVWRRPPSDAELERLLALSADNEPWDVRVRSALVALLASPSFVLRAEGTHGEAWGLASRLAFFLWSSAPDERLLDLAERGALADALDAEVARMLDDPRASALARTFAPQWLQLERLDGASPDPRRFPGVDEALLRAMRAESELFFEAVLREKRPARELVDADFTFVNAALAAHYGIPGVRGDTLRRVRVPEGLRTQRGGLLGHASVLTATSNPTRTSPVLRGKWLLEVVLGTPPPPPPPGVGDLDDGEAAAQASSLRERLERHRDEARCAVCHAPMDALGFGLESYDAVGAWREHDGHFAIDAHGTLADGRAFDGPAGLRALLANEAAFPRALAARLATFALGRELELDEEAELAARVDALGDHVAPLGPTLAELVLAVVQSRAFSCEEVAR